MNCTVEVSARGVWLPNRTGTETVEDLVQEVADRVTEMVLSADRQHEQSEGSRDATAVEASAGASSE
jgi:hypothetical protein